MMQSLFDYFDTILWYIDSSLLFMYTTSSNLYNTVKVKN